MVYQILYHTVSIDRVTLAPTLVPVNVIEDANNGNEHGLTTQVMRQDVHTQDDM